MTQETFPNIKAKVGATTQYGATIPIKEDVDEYQLAKMTKAFLIADHLEYDISERIGMAAAFIDRYEIEEDLMDAKALLNLSNTFHQYLADNFSIKKIHRKYPIRHFHNKRLFETIIDFVIETEQGIVLIQNSDSIGGSKKWNKKIKELSSWLHLSKEALALIFQRNKIRTFVHFVMGGGLVAVETQIKIKTKAV